MLTLRFFTPTLSETDTSEKGTLVLFDMVAMTNVDLGAFLSHFVIIALSSLIFSLVDAHCATAKKQDSPSPAKAMTKVALSPMDVSAENISKRKENIALPSFSPNYTIKRERRQPGKLNPRPKQAGAGKGWKR